MSTCQGESGYAYRDDEVASEIRERMRHKDHAIIDRSFNTPENFMEKAAGLDIVLGTRMHACILAMLAGVPSVNVEYEFKSRELYNRLALEDLIVDILEFKAEELAAKTVARAHGSGFGPNDGSSRESRLFANRTRLSRNTCGNVSADMKRLAPSLQPACPRLR